MHDRPHHGAAGGTIARQLVCDQLSTAWAFRAVGAVELMKPSTYVTSLIEISNLHTVFEVFESETDAMESFS